jgi:hypothetical protein
VVAFTDDYLSLGADGVGQFLRQWDELADIAEAPDGILFYWRDGTKHWLPTRVFASENDRNYLMGFLRGRERVAHPHEPAGGPPGAA